MGRIIKIECKLSSGVDVFVASGGKNFGSIDLLSHMFPKAEVTSNKMRYTQPHVVRGSLRIWKYVQWCTFNIIDVI